MKKKTVTRKQQSALAASDAGLTLLPQMMVDEISPNRCARRRDRP